MKVRLSFMPNRTISRRVCCCSAFVTDRRCPVSARRRPEGDAVTLTVVWETEDGTRSEAAETFLFDGKTRRPAQHGAWVFNGSTTENGRFKAMEEESYITTYWDPWAIINLSGKIGADDERVSVNRETIPPLHTPIRLIVRPAEAP
jgi:hypothetical protein